MKLKKELVLIFLILGLAGIFRLYHLKEFFYWSTDEELVATFARRLLIESRPFLSIPVGTLGLNLGPFFYYLTALILFLGKLNPLVTALFGSLVGILITFLAYFLMGKMFSKKVGVLTAFLYGTSFFMSLFDRRWWPLSLDPLWFFLGFWALFKLVRGENKYFSLLAAVLVMALNADPTVLVFWLAAGAVFLIWRLPILKRDFLLGWIIILIGILPILLTEVKHGFGGVRVLVSGQFLGRVMERAPLAVDWRLFLAAPAKLLYTPAGRLAEKEFCYCYEFFKYDLGVILGMLIVFLSFVLGFFLFLPKTKKKKEILGLKILYVIFLAAFLGILVFVWSGHNFYQHYLLIILPGFLVLWAVWLEKIWKRNKAIMGWLLLAFLVLNLRSLFLVRADFGYERKIAAIEWVVAKVGEGDFGLYTSEDGWLQGGGWTYLFFYKGKTPTFSYGNYYLNQLLGKGVEEKKTNKIVLMVERGYWEKKRELADEIKKHLIARKDFENFEIVIFDNQEGWVEKGKVAF
jgi:4-amino-4-deoxy-L-arabinose transferase-like glycosyltransferase